MTEVEPKKGTAQLLGTVQRTIKCLWPALTKIASRPNHHGCWRRLANRRLAPAAVVPPWLRINVIIDKIFNVF